MNLPPQLPPDFFATRAGLHQLAFYVLAPARYAVTGRMGLVADGGGLATPTFGDTRRLLVKGSTLTVEGPAESRSTPITTLQQAAEHAGIAYRPVWFDGFRDPLPPADPTIDLGISTDASLALGQWLAFSWKTLERLRGDAEASAAPSSVQLWPEHFDAAVEIGDESRGQRAAFGGSPGDKFSDDPYVYVSPWVKEGLDHSFWNAPFGALLGYKTLLSATDAQKTALAFYRRGLDLLQGRTGLS